MLCCMRYFYKHKRNYIAGIIKGMYSYKIADLGKGNKGSRMEKSPHLSHCLLYFSIYAAHFGLLLHCVQCVPVYRTVAATPDKNGYACRGDTVNRGDWKAQQYWSHYWDKE
jgi:hypothetical protein